MPGTRLRVKERNDLIRHNVSLGNGVLPDYSRNRWAQGKMVGETGRVYTRQFWEVCRASYILARFLSRRLLVSRLVRRDAWLVAAVKPM